MRLFLFLILLNLCFYSCKKYDAALTAFYLKPSKASVTSNLSQGSNSSKITDLWVYTNGQFQGAFPYNHLIPIVNNNKSAKIQIFAGIKNNGIAETRVFWPFYSPLEFDTLIESGKTIEMPLVFEYNSNTKFVINENFDNVGNVFNNSSISDTIYNITSSEESLEGNYLKLELKGQSVIGQIETSQTYSLPAGSENVYLELNYKCNKEFSIGLIGDKDPQLKEAITLSAKENWNKIYIQLSNTVSSAPVSNKYKLYFRMINNNDNSKLYIDNLKLIYL